MKFSIIIPTKDSPRQAVVLLHLLTKISYKKEDYEIVVIDNDSEETNYKLLKRGTERLKKDVKITLLRENRAGMSFARNCGIRAARYNTIIFLDDDVLIPRDLLTNYDRAWQKHKDASIIGGKVTAVLGHGRLSDRQKEMIRKHPWCFNELNLGKYDRKLKLGELFYSCNMSMKIIKKNIGAYLFEESLGKVVSGNLRICAEDYEICSRFILEDREVWYGPTLGVSHITGMNRFSGEYIPQRYFLAGLERFLMDRVLSSKFDNHVSYWQSFISSFKISIFSFSLKVFREYLNSKYDLLMLFNYYLQMKYLRHTKNKKLSSKVRIAKQT